MKSIKNQTPPANVNGQNRKKEKFVNHLIFSRGRRHLRPTKGEILSRVLVSANRKKEVCVISPFLLASIII